MGGDHAYLHEADQSLAQVPCWYPHGHVCAKLASASGCKSRPRKQGTGGAAMSCDLRSPSRYRVLRVAVSRGTPRSVDRECAGRNASSVKVSSPDRHAVPWWPSQYEEAKAAPTGYTHVGTTGVQGHGMYTRQVSEPGRSARSGASKFVSHGRSSSEGQGLRTKSRARARAEVRSRHSSEEVG